MRMQTARPGALSMARVAAAASCIMLTGCTTWVKPGANAAMLDAAETHCTAVSYATLPANIQTTSSTGGPTYGELKKCEKNSNGGECRKINGRFTAVQKVTSDTNSQGRDAVFRDCMMSNGWTGQ